jgi:L-cystine uptake protein TcyP (sodium:dicarboxylate symporter family)
MSMTHYMGLLASNQPWNLIIFMAIPVVLAETIAITELYLLFTRNFTNKAKTINKWAGIIVGIYFLGIFVYLFTNAVVPITTSGEWRGFVDVIAVGFYLLGVVPLFGITLLELGVISKNKTPEEKLKLHVIFVALFLVVAHIAMIFGMVNPEIYSGNTMTTDSMHMEMSK